MSRLPPGYSLIELLVVLAALGILVAMAMPLAQTVAQHERERDLKAALWTIRESIDSWHRACEIGAIAAPPPCYPPSLAALVQPYPDRRAGPGMRPDGQPQPLRFLRRVPRDPFADTSLSPELTWGLRSYRSEADSPREGSEVYDIYSRQSGVGSNGVPLREW